MENENEQIIYINIDDSGKLVSTEKVSTYLCCIINNEKVYPNIKDNTASRGRFLDYALKLLIKQTIKGLIKEEKIDPHKPIRLILNIDDLLEFSKRTDFINYKIILP